MEYYAAKIQQIRRNVELLQVDVIVFTYEYRPYLQHRGFSTLVTTLGLHHKIHIRLVIAPAVHMRHLALVLSGGGLTSLTPR